MRLPSFVALLVCLLPAVGLGQVAAEGVLLLRDGRRLPGELRSEGSRYAVTRDGSTQRVDEEDVVRWVPREELLAHLERLEAQPGAESAFATTQRAIFCFENGLDDEGWERYAALRRQQSTPPSFGRLRELAAARLLAQHDERSLEQQGRKLLLRCLDPKGDARREAHNDAAAFALGQLLAAERAGPEADAEPEQRRETTAAPAVAPLAALVRDYAQEALGTSRREVARQALLGADDPQRHFVYRLAARHPDGPTRSSIVSELEQRQLRDEAARYLGDCLNARGGTPRLRTVEVLAALRSAAALPALKTARSHAIKHLTRLASGAGPAAPRSYIAITEQQSYIADFDVEVASNATIADPVVRTIESGVVLDASVIAVEEVHYYTRLVRKIDEAMRAIGRPAK